MKAKPTKHSGEVLLKVNRGDELLLDAASRTERSSPFRIKTILVPIDFSDCAKKALQYALPLAKEHEAAITLVHVIATPSYPIGEFGGLEYATLQADTSDLIDKKLNELAVDEAAGEVPVDAVVRTGSPAAEIIDVARKLPADVIVISTHGRTGLKHVLLGSVAEQVVRHAPCPVLVVREREHEFLGADA